MNTKRIVTSNILLSFFCCYLESAKAFAVEPNDITTQLENGRADAFDAKITLINNRRNPIVPNQITTQLENGRADAFDAKIRDINNRRNPIVPNQITTQLDGNKANAFDTKIRDINNRRGIIVPNQITDRLDANKANAFNTKINNINNRRGIIFPNQITAQLDPNKVADFQDKIDAINAARGATPPAPSPSATKLKLPLSKFAMSAGIEADFIEPGISARLFYGFGNAKIHGLGVYYKLNSNLKTGLGFIYGQGKVDLDKNPSSGDPITNGQIKQNMPAGFADIVYNFIQAPTIFSPYLGVRLGYAKHTLKFLEDNKEILPSETFNGILYGLKLGVELNISDRIAIDLAYIGNSFGSKETNYFEKQKLSHSAAAIIKVSL